MIKTKGNSALYSSVIISPINSVNATIQYFKPSFVISILGKSDEYAFPSLSIKNHLCLNFDDVGYTSEFGRAPDLNDISMLIDFSKNWNRKGELLIHCKAGTSRSPAAAIIALWATARGTPENDIFNLLKLKSYYRPNITMLRLADNILKTDSKLADVTNNFQKTNIVNSMGAARLVITD
jgi:predicted protein tyrosine phosphatase